MNFDRFSCAERKFDPLPCADCGQPLSSEDEGAYFDRRLARQTEPRCKQCQTERDVMTDG